MLQTDRIIVYLQMYSFQSLLNNQKREGDAISPAWLYVLTSELWPLQERNLLQRNLSKQGFCRGKHNTPVSGY